MRLNKNQVLNRVTNAMKGLRAATDGLHVDDVRAVVQHCVKLLLPADEAEAAADTPEAMDALILKAIRSGLESSDPQMVRAAMERQSSLAGLEYLKELFVNIVPYTIKDTSLRNIVLKAGDDVVAEIAAALTERRAKGRVIEAAPAEE
jgi:hypothetical protein